jgi:hypothetical protein
MDHSQASKLVSGIRDFYGTMSQRQAAFWDHACAVVEALDSWAPAAFPDFPPVLDQRPLSEIQNALNTAGHADADPLTRMVAASFALYRHEVLNVEAANAGRLTVVAGALSRLFELAETAEHAETRALVDEMIGHFEAHVRARWNTAFPRHASVRDWPILVTRRYDLLPIAWRYLGPVETRERFRADRFADRRAA